MFISLMDAKLIFVVGLSLRGSAGHMLQFFEPDVCCFKRLFSRYFDPPKDLHHHI